jgi:uncharacterized RDD family membrane protein YckC
VEPSVTTGEADLVTPEAVVLDLPIASVGSRALALVLDYLIQGALGLALVFAASAIGLSEGGWVGVVVVLLAVFALLFGYPVAFETLWRGRTPGKAALGLRVVTVEAGPVAFRHAAIRAALALVEILATSGGIAVVSALLTRRAQRLGDLAAGTVVIREKSGAGQVAPARFLPPPGAEDYTARLDVSALTEDDYLAVRSLLVRRERLQPAVLESLAREVATTLLPRVQPAPPAGMPAGVFLAALAAAYQQRHAWRGGGGVGAWVWAQPDGSGVGPAGRAGV